MTIYEARLTHLGTDTQLTDSILSQLLGIRHQPNLGGVVTQAWIENGWIMIEVDCDKVDGPAGAIGKTLADMDQKYSILKE